MKINAHGYTDQFEQFVAFANNQRNPASSTAVAQAADVANWFAGLPDSLSDANVKEFRAGWAAAYNGGQGFTLIGGGLLPV